MRNYKNIKLSGNDALEIRLDYEGVMVRVIGNVAKRSEGSPTNRSVIGIQPDYEGIMDSRHW